MLPHKSTLICCLLSVGAATFAAEPRIDITAQLLGYDLVQATGSTSENTELPRITVRAGSEGMIDISRDFKYRMGLAPDGKSTGKRVAHLGIRIPVYVHMVGEGKLGFLLRVELCEREDLTDPFSAVLEGDDVIRGSGLARKYEDDSGSDSDRKIGDAPDYNHAALTAATRREL